MQILLRSVAAAAVVLAFACKQGASEKAPEKAALPYGTAVDTAYGWRGMDMVSMKIVSDSITEFKSPKYTVKALTAKDAAGASFIVSAEGMVDYVIPNLGGYHFMGISGDNLFIDAGTGPDGREILIYSMALRAKSWQAPYVDTPFVVSNLKLWYYTPVPAEQVKDTVDCPHKAEWEAQGLRTGYGKLQIFQFVGRSLVSKPEYKCVPMQ